MATPSPVSHHAGVILAAPTDGLGVCLDRMAAANVGSILVTEHDRPVGILTERDVLRLWRRLTAPGAAAQPIGAVCTRPVFTLTLATLAKAPTEMVQRRIRHIPVVDDQGEVIGIVSMRDVLSAQMRVGKLPTLKAVSAATTAGVLHLLTPTAQLAQVCTRFLPPSWKCRIWQTIGALEQALDDPKSGVGGGRTAFMLDLDGLGHGEDWRPLVRRFIKQLTSRDQPELFLVSTPVRFPPEDVLSLRAVAAKAHWRLYQRPLPVTTLGDDLAHLAAGPGGQGTAVT